MKRPPLSQVKLNTFESDLSDLRFLQLKLKNHRLRRQLLRQHERVQLQTLRQCYKTSLRRDWMIFFTVLLLIYLFWQWMSLDIKVVDLVMQHPSSFLSHH